MSLALKKLIQATDYIASDTSYMKLNLPVSLLVCYKENRKT